MLISIFASIGSQNLGDELILKNEIKILEKDYGKQTKFIVFSYDPKNPFFKQKNITYKEYFPIGIRKKSNFFRNIRNFFVFLYTTIKSDLIIIGGGGLIYDNEIKIKGNPLDKWIFRTKIFKSFNKKVEFFRIGINIKNKENLDKIKEIFSIGKYISLRDEYSNNLLKELGIDSTIKKDPVFYDDTSPQPSPFRRGSNKSPLSGKERGLGGEVQKIDSVKKLKKNFLIKKIKSYDFSYNDIKNTYFNGKRVGIAFRKGYLSNDKKNIKDNIEQGKINEIINFILKSGGNIVLLPHSFHKLDINSNDYVFLKQFLRKEILQKYSGKISICKNMQETYEQYKNKKIDICLSQRLHSMILSNVYGIPFIGISYSKKTDEFLKGLFKKIKNG